MASKSPKELSILDFNYTLPIDKIAITPCIERDQSKLLIYQNGVISESVFKHISEFIPSNAMLVFNNSRVINARIKFKKETGGEIEIFCLEPYEDEIEYTLAMVKKKSVIWKCFIGGASKWKEPILEKKLTVLNEEVLLKVKIIKKLSDGYLVEFNWGEQDYTWAEILSVAGNIPLPPYIKRTLEISDSNRYQTIYAKIDGSVAAPTAGLHFTENIFEQLAKKNIHTANVTLHVGAGTFKPVKAVLMGDHEMHTEWIDVSIPVINSIIESRQNIFAVGTTSLRTLESLYWLGVKSILYPEAEKLQIEQWDILDEKLKNVNTSSESALSSLVKWIEKKGLSNILTQTQLLITPGYRFKITKGLITNFHQPQSTLLLLVAAAIGNDWRKCYDYALSNDFRFLSYGDANLLFMAE
jgi:S-adenosylmethionine:tRNA ribosyltransferase-isomerase